MGWLQLYIHLLTIQGNLQFYFQVTTKNIFVNLKSDSTATTTTTSRKYSTWKETQMCFLVAKFSLFLIGDPQLLA